MSLFSLDKERLNYFEKLSKAIQLLVNISTMSEEDESRAVWAFMMSVGKLFLEYFQYDLETAREIGENNQKILREGEKFILRYVFQSENTLSGDLQGGCEWETASTERTNIEAFNEMFKGVVAPLDTEGIELSMQSVNKKHKCVEPDHIPKNVPKSHWWWFV